MKKSGKTEPFVGAIAAGLCVYGLFLLSSCVRFEPRGFLFIATDTVFMDQGDKSIYEFEGSILNIGEEGIEEHGFCWAKTQTPNIWDSSTELGPIDSKGSFTSIIEGFQAHTTYYFRAYVRTAEGIFYANEKSFTTTTLSIPTVETLSAIHINQNSAVSRGTVLLEGVSPVTRRGVCWSVNQGPTLSDRVAEQGEGAGTYEVELKDLEINTNYYVRAFASNEVGTAYGEESTFKTWAEGEFADYDGNIYPSIVIGDQTWMKKNLRVTHYADGRAIPEVPLDWAGMPAGTKAYCWAYNNPENADPYGALYTWSTAMDGAQSSDGIPSQVQGVCPDGWHLPSDQEWQQMELFIGMDPAEVDTLGYRERGEGFGGRLKEPGNKHWRNPNANATNFTGFTAVAGGSRSIDGNFRNLGREATFWSAAEFNPTSAWVRGLYYNNSFIRRAYDNKGNAASVRCIKDEALSKSSKQ